MTDINETRLPGLGVRHDFASDSGDQIGVITHHAGRREIVIYDPADPDRVAARATMSAHEAGVLVDILGGTGITQRFDDLRQEIAGLAIDWLPINPRSGSVGRSIGETELRSRTGVSIVAILRGDTPIPAPGPDEVLAAEDTAVVVGTAAGINAASVLLSRAAG